MEEIKGGGGVALKKYEFGNRWNLVLKMKLWFVGSLSTLARTCRDDMIGGDFAAAGELAIENLKKGLQLAFFCLNWGWISRRVTKNLLHIIFRIREAERNIVGRITFYNRNYRLTSWLKKYCRCFWIVSIGRLKKFYIQNLCFFLVSRCWCLELNGWNDFHNVD